MGTLIKPFGYLLKVLADLFQNNYGWAIIGFTVIVNLLMLPLVIKQQKSTAQMQKINPKLQALQAKYKNDKEKLNQEMMKLYQESGINPMGGCLPLLIQFPIILILYQAITRPLTYMYNLSQPALTQLQQLLGIDTTSYVQEIEMLQQISAHPEISQMAEYAHIPMLNFNFFGLNLASRPSLSQIDLLWLIPILSALTSYLLSKLTMMQSGQQMDSDNPAASSMNSMNKVMPLMSAFFTFSFPAGIGLYWVMSNVVRIAQQHFIHLYIKRTHPTDDPLIIEQPASTAASSPKKKKKGRKK